MRKVAVIVALGIVAVGALSAMAQTVTSVNVAGLYRVHVNQGAQDIVGISVDQIDPADATLLGVFGGKLREAGLFDFQNADQVLLWDNANSAYRAFGLKNTDHQFHNASALSKWIGAATNAPVGPGDAFWLQATALGPIDLAVTGEAVDDATMEVPLTNGFQFACYPLSTSIALQNTTFAADGAQSASGFAWQDADKILLWNGTAYVQLGLKEVSPGVKRWWTAGNLTQWINPAGEANVTLAVGQGFWYESRGGGFVWSEDNPYLGNL